MRSLIHSRTLAGLLAVVSSSLALASCASELTRTGSSPGFIIIDSLLGASGAEPNRFGSPLLSDVVTVVEQQVGGAAVRVPTTFNDLARVQMRVGLKNPNSPTGPSTLSAITLNRYRVTYQRSDGRNTPGVEVPHPFDGAVTVTVPADGQVQFAFEVVRNQAKLESPLRNLREGGGAILISTIAEIAFYGRDQVGNEVVATGTMSINFGDFADPR